MMGILINLRIFTSPFAGEVARRAGEGFPIRHSLLWRESMESPNKILK